MKALFEFLATALRTTLKIRKHERVRKWRAASTRRRSNTTFIAITGSSGKSTTTALISHILSGIAAVRTHMSANRYRGHIKSLQNALPECGYYVGELSAEGPRTLQPAIDVIRPTVGVVTLVALEHKSAFRTCEAVAEEKQRLVETLPANGLAILNYDDPRVAAMAERTKARVVSFGQTGGDYVLSNVDCPAPGELGLTVTYQGQAFHLTSRLTGVHQSVAVAAAFSCTHQLGVAPDLIVERMAGFAPVFGRCSVHRAENGPVFIVDTVKAPYHSLQLALDMIAGFSAPRKRIIIGNVSDFNKKSDRVYRDIYQAARAIADRVIFVGEHSHRSKATAEEIAAGRFVRFDTAQAAAEFLKESAIPDEIILLKASRQRHLERLMLGFFTSVRCWTDACGVKETCVGCGLYGAPFEQHKTLRRAQASPLPAVHCG